jgi:hypothetical protein
VTKTIVVLALAVAALIVALVFLRQPLGRPIDPDDPAQSVSQAPGS